MSKLIIGSNSWLARNFIASCGTTINLVSMCRSPNSPEELYLDLSNFNSTPPIPKGVTHAVFFAGISSIVECQDYQESSRLVNYTNTCKLIAQLNAMGIRCLFLSSSTVFSNSSIDHFEYSETLPDTFYGQLKLDSEQVILQSPLNTVLRLTKILSCSSALLTQWSTDLLSGKQVSAFSDLFLSPVSPQSVAKWISSQVGFGFPLFWPCSSASHHHKYPP